MDLRGGPPLRAPRLEEVLERSRVVEPNIWVLPHVEALLEQGIGIRDAGVARMRQVVD